jgi:hypothetical protein
VMPFFMSEYLTMRVIKEGFLKVIMSIIFPISNTYRF